MVVVAVVAAAAAAIEVFKSWWLKKPVVMNKIVGPVFSEYHLS